MARSAETTRGMLPGPPDYKMFSKTRRRLQAENSLRLGRMSYVSRRLLAAPRNCHQSDQRASTIAFDFLTRATAPFANPTSSGTCKDVREECQSLSRLGCTAKGTIALGPSRGRRRKEEEFLALLSCSPEENLFPRWTAPLKTLVSVPDVPKLQHMTARGWPVQVAPA